MDLLSPMSSPSSIATTKASSNGDEFRGKRGTVPISTTDKINSGCRVPSKFSNLIYRTKSTSTCEYLISHISRACSSSTQKTYPSHLPIRHFLPLYLADEIFAGWKSRRCYPILDI